MEEFGVTSTKSPITVDESLTHKYTTQPDPPVTIPLYSSLYNTQSTISLTHTLGIQPFAEPKSRGTYVRENTRLQASTGTHGSAQAATNTVRDTSTDNCEMEQGSQLYRIDRNEFIQHRLPLDNGYTLITTTDRRRHPLKRNKKSYWIYTNNTQNKLSACNSKNSKTYLVTPVLRFFR